MRIHIAFKPPPTLANIGPKSGKAILAYSHDLKMLEELLYQKTKNTLYDIWKFVATSEQQSSAFDHLSGN